MADNSKTFQCNIARATAEIMVAKLAPAVKRIEIAGSIRRGCPVVHDIDLVVWAVYDDREQTNLFGDKTVIAGPPALLVNAFFGEQTNPDLFTEAKILHNTVDGIPVEIYLAERDGSNFEALWQMRTGSASYNAWLAGRAKRMNLTYKAGYGIYRGDERMDDGTEAGVFKALGLVYATPEQRG